MLDSMNFNSNTKTPPETDVAPWCYKWDAMGWTGYLRVGPTAIPPPSGMRCSAPQGCTSCG